MTAIACLLLATVGYLSFEAFAACFRPARRALCQAAPAYPARHQAEG